jgi:hypothetical protein
MKGLGFRRRVLVLLAVLQARRAVLCLWAGCRGVSSHPVIKVRVNAWHIICMPSH